MSPVEGVRDSPDEHDVSLDVLGMTGSHYVVRVESECGTVSDF